MKIERAPFADLDGNTQGYVQRGRKTATSSIATRPTMTLFVNTASRIYSWTGIRLHDSIRRLICIPHNRARTLGFCIALVFIGLQHHLYLWNPFHGVPGN